MRESPRKNCVQKRQESIGKGEREREKKKEQEREESKTTRPKIERQTK